MISNRVKSHVKQNHLLNPGHYSGWQRLSTTYALLHLTSWIKLKWRENKVVGTFFVNVQAAFPTVYPARLISTLKTIGVFPALCNLINNYLSNRATTIAFGEFKSESKSLIIGSPRDHLCG